jgi:hypothetical protein
MRTVIATLVALIVLSVCVEAKLPDGYVGVVAYLNSDNRQSPAVRFWTPLNETHFSDEIRLANTTTGTNDGVQIHTNGNKTILLVFSTVASDKSHLSAYVCVDDCLNETRWTQSYVYLMYGSALNYPAGVFDKEGRFVIVFSRDTTDKLKDFTYGVLNASSVVFDTITYTDYDFTVIYPNNKHLMTRWKGVSSRDYDNMLFITLDWWPATMVHGFIWNGTGFGDHRYISYDSIQHTGGGGFDLGITSKSGHLVAVGNNRTTSGITQQVWNGTAWLQHRAYVVDAGQNQNNRWVLLSMRNGTDDWMILSVDAANDLHTAFWNSTSETWVITENIDEDVDYILRQTFDFEWARDGSNGILVWDTSGSGSTDINYIICDPVCNATAQQTQSGFPGSGLQLRMFPNQGIAGDDVIGFRHGSAGNLIYFTFNGTDINRYSFENLSTALHSSYETFAFASIPYTYEPEEEPEENVIVLPITDDAKAREASPASNYGTTTVISFSRDWSTTHETSMLRVNLTTLPSEITVNEAWLQINITTNRIEEGETLHLGAYLVSEDIAFYNITNGSWIEGARDAQPAEDYEFSYDRRPIAASHFVNTSSCGGYIIEYGVVGMVNVSLTGCIAEAYRGGQSYASIYIDAYSNTTTSDDVVDAMSKENAGAATGKPSVIVVYSGGGEPPSDSCTPSAGQPWAIDMSDNCVFSGSTTVSSITFSGTGSFTNNGTIHTETKGSMSNGMKIISTSSSKWVIGSTSAEAESFIPIPPATGVPILTGKEYSLVVLVVLLLSFLKYRFGGVYEKRR